MDPDDLPVLLAAMTESPERVAVANDSAEGLRHALTRLPVPQARAVAMSGIYGMTAKQVERDDSAGAAAEHIDGFGAEVDEQPVRIVAVGFDAPLRHRPIEPTSRKSAPLIANDGVPVG